MMKIVVTGGLGHIGSRLIRDIPGEFPGAEIVILDNLSTQRYCSLFHLPTGERFRFLESDILTADLLPLLGGASAVVHLAARTDAETSFRDPAHVERTNFLGTERVARACVSSGAPLIFLSTTSVYGPRGGVVDEDCSPGDLCPQSPYAESKLQAERLLRDLGVSENLRFVICRFGTIFGPSPGMRFHTAINKFCWQAITGQPLTVWRTALDQNRPYLELGDGVRAILFLLRENLYDGSVYNVLTMNTSVREVVQAISRFVPDVRVKTVDTEIMNQLSYHVIADRFSQMGFRYRGSLEQGIQETIDLFRGIRQW
jgi:nucleoside-diphosphate-sugar epimerase